MLPGPNYVYKCPRCGNLLTVGSILSGNTIGAKIYSDGKRIAPMLPDFPDLTKCKKCETIFWLNILRKIGRYEWGDKMNSKWAKADDADFLDIEDYFRALDDNVAENAAIIYSMMGCCKASEVNFRDWLVYFLDNVHHYDNDYTMDLAELLPHHLAEQTKKEYPTQIRELSKFSEHLGETLKDGLIIIV